MRVAITKLSEANYIPIDILVDLHADGFFVVCQYPYTSSYNDKLPLTFPLSRRL